jgi:hypothetical protein
LAIEIGYSRAGFSTIKLGLVFIGVFLLGFVVGYQYALNEQGGVVE